MCGIFGMYGMPRYAAEPSVLTGLDRIKHRGPDGIGMVVRDRAVHGHVRLAIRDLSSASSQPYILPDDEGVLSWVGEIWNWRSLKTKLTLLGHKFKTTGDTEVLARSLLEWGVRDALDKLDGMFSFVWSDGSDGHWIARDRFGKVPLYVIRKCNTFTWSSERQGFAGQDGGMAVAFPPGSLLDLNTGKLVRYSWLSRTKGDDSLPAKEFVRDTVSILNSAVSRRLDADAPVCCLISGGLDSSLVLALAVRLRGKDNVTAYTAVLDRETEDHQSARSLCAVLGVNLYEVKVKRPSEDDLRHACLINETASKVQAELAHLCLPLAKAIHQDGFKVCLSGEGADELFGGYGNSIIKASTFDDGPVGDDQWRFHRRKLVEKMARGNFIRCNKVFMSQGVECRLPFTDSNLIDLVLPLGRRGCPPGKDLLKLAARGLIPDWVIDRRKDTFQGGSGMSAWVEKTLADPESFFRSEIRKRFGRLVRG